MMLQANKVACKPVKKWTIASLRLLKGSKGWAGTRRRGKTRKSWERIERRQQVSFQCLSNRYLLLTQCKPHVCGQYDQSPYSPLSLFSTSHACLDLKGVTNGFRVCVCVCTSHQWFILPLLYHIETWCWKPLAGSWLTKLTPEWCTKPDPRSHWIRNLTQVHITSTHHIVYVL